MAKFGHIEEAKIVEPSPKEKPPKPHLMSKFKSIDDKEFKEEDEEEEKEDEEDEEEEEKEEEEEDKLKLKEASKEKERTTESKSKRDLNKIEPKNWSKKKEEEGDDDDEDNLLHCLNRFFMFGSFSNIIIIFC